MLFDNPLGWYSFIAVGVLVISYLIKPKPLDIKIPSVRFLMHEKGTRQKSTFFQRFITNLLFLLQLLALAALALATTLPIISMTYDSTGERTVLVLDASNSMNTEVSVGQTRFDKAKSIAENNLKGQVSIILAETVPLLVLEDESTSQAKSVLAQLTPKHTSTNIGDAMILAGDLLSAKGDNNKASGRILVISDFVWTDGADPEVMKQVLEARGMVVDFVNIGKAKENVGFVDFKIDTTETTVFLKNYGREKTVSLLLKNEMEGQKTITRTLLEEGIEPITFPTMGGITRLELKDDDALTDDNAVYLSNPKKTKIRILMMTNKPNKFMVNALTALGDAEVVVAEPPIVPDIKRSEGDGKGGGDDKGFDIMIYSEVEHKKILPGTMKDIKQHVEQGTPFIVTFQETLNQIDFDGLLAISPDIVHEGAGVKTVIQNQFTKDVDFGTTKKYYKAKADNTSLVLAVANDEQESPIVAIKQFKDGKIVYYGMDDLKSSFKNSPGYPIFWNGLKNFLIGVDDITNFNHRAGTVLTFEMDKRVETPYGIVQGKRVVLDTNGIYLIDGKQHTVNTWNEKESDTLAEASVSEAKKGDSYQAEEVLRERDVSLEMILLIIASVIIAAELLYTKFRGDF